MFIIRRQEQSLDNEAQTGIACHECRTALPAVDQPLQSVQPEHVLLLLRAMTAGAPPHQDWLGDFRKSKLQRLIGKPGSTGWGVAVLPEKRAHRRRGIAREKVGPVT